MTLKENIGRLVKLHMVKNKKNCILYGSAIMIFALIQFILAAKTLIEQDVFAVQYFYNMNMAFFMLFGFAILFGLEGYTILCDDSISMYPGTIKSRFIARIIGDHMVMLIVLCMSVVVYLLQGLLILLLSAMSDGAVIGSALDIQYLLWGVLRTFGFALLAYSLFTLWFVLLVRFPGVGYAIVGAVVLLGVISVGSADQAFEVSQKVSEIYSFYAGKGDSSAYTGILACIATWAVLLLAAWLIGSRAKLWKSQKNVLLYGSIAFMYCIFCLCMSGMVMASNKEISVDTLSPEQMGNVVSSSLDLSGFPQKGLWSFSESEYLTDVILYREDDTLGVDSDEKNNMEISVEFLSESEARKRGLSVPEGAVDENHVYLMAWGKNSSYRGKDLLKPFLEEYIEKVSLQCELDEDAWMEIKFIAGVKPFTCLVNGLYGDVHQLMKDTTYDYGMDDMLESHLCQLVVYSDKLQGMPEDY